MVLSHEWAWRGCDQVPKRKSSTANAWPRKEQVNEKNCQQDVVTVTNRKFKLTVKRLNGNRVKNSEATDFVCYII